MMKRKIGRGVMRARNREGGVKEDRENGDLKRDVSYVR